jgi:hypothetical protein
MNRILIGCFTLYAVSTAIADPVDIPNQFQAGTPAVAAEVNANFDAVEVAVDDNAQRIADVEITSDDNAQRVATLESAITTAGVAVRVDGIVIGRYLAHGSGAVEVDITAAAGGGTVRVAEAVGVGSASEIFVVSPTGYRFAVATSDFDNPRLSEGDLGFSVLFYESVDCTGNAYIPVEGDTGFFSLFQPSVGAFRPMKRWSARQGLVFSSPDPADSTPAYMVRRGATAQTVALGSLLIYSSMMNQAICIDLSVLPNFDINDPLDVNNTVVPVEALDSVEAGVSGVLGGELTIGL